MQELSPDLETDPEFFTPLAEYQPGNQYYDHVTSLLPSMWRLKQEYFWTYALSPKVLRQVQGWKIHVSALPDAALRILGKVAPLCIAHGIEFKFASDLRILKELNGKGCARQLAGKFMALYPTSEAEFKALLEALYPALREENGPYVLSDRQYRDCKVLFYRYGGFLPLPTHNVNGKTSYSIVDDKFGLIDDLRKPHFHLPPFIQDSLVPAAAPASGKAISQGPKEAPVLGGRYQVESVMKQSNGGGVYRAITIDTQQAAVLKEARPYVGVDSRGGDAISRLEKEFRLMSKVAGRAIAPEPYGLFSEWRHAFLAQEFFDGMTLQAFRARYSALLNVGRPAQEVVQWMAKVVRLAIDLVQKVTVLHEHNIVFGDLSVYNVLINAETLEMRLIDFEGAFEIGVDNPANTMTPGFFRHERWGRQAATFGDDYYALGCVLLAMVVPNSAMPSLKSDYVGLVSAELGEDYGLPAAYGECVAILLAGNDGCLAESLARLRAIETGGMSSMPLEAKGVLRQPERYAALVQEVFRYTESVMDLERSRRAFPIGPRFKDALAVDYGALGIAYAWRRAGRPLPSAFTQWIGHRFQSGGRLPGLMNGLSGMAWVLAELGMERHAADAINTAGTHRMLYQSMSLGYGAAGYGMSRLHLWHKTGDPQHLREAQRIADVVCETALPQANGCSWEDPEAEDGAALGWLEGGSGIALFLLYMHCATAQERYLEVGEQGMAFEMGYGVRSGGKLEFPRRSKNKVNIISPYLMDGTAGVATTALRYYALTGKAVYRQLLQDTKPSLAAKYAVSPELFQGLSGIGNYLLDAHEFLGDESYLDLAHRLARSVCLFEVVREGGSSFQLGPVTKIGCDYAGGSAGVALFLDRLARGGGNFNFVVDQLLHERIAARRAASANAGS